MNTNETIAELTTHATAIKGDGSRPMHTMEVCDEWRQGDVRVRRLHDDAVEQLGEKLVPIKNFDGQVAPGTTIGSRHILDSLGGVTAYVLRDASAIDGPIIKITEPRTLRHPEHGDCVGLPAGIYAFPGQRVYAEELRRVMD